MVPKLPYIPVVETLLRLVYPGRCRACGSGLRAGERFFCAGCLGGVKPLSGPICRVCGMHFPDGSGGGRTCADCIRKRPAYDFAKSSTAYAGVVKEAILLYKYDKVRAMGGYLGGLVEDGALEWFTDATVVAAVPLHKRRLRHRGFNQSLTLAWRAAGAIGVKLSIDSLARIRHTRPQVDLDPSEREKNVRGAFAALRPGEFMGQRVLLVDDVYTTGATVNECAKVLKNAGAEAVYVLTVARAINHS